MIKSSPNFFKNLKKLRVLFFSRTNVEKDNEEIENNLNTCIEKISSISQDPNGMLLEF